MQASHRIAFRSLLALLLLGAVGPSTAPRALADPDPGVDEPAPVDPPADEPPEPPAETIARDPFKPYDLGPDAIDEAHMTPDQRRDAEALAESAQRLTSSDISASIHTATQQAAQAALAAAQAEIAGLADAAVLGVIP